MSDQKQRLIEHYADTLRGMTQVISLGAGVQSSAMALMATNGVLTPMPAAAIFADTQDEPASVYRWLDYIEPLLAFPLYRVTAGRLSDDVLKMRRTKDGRLYSRTDIPLFTRGHDGSEGKIRFRSCTVDFKISPILRKLREIGGIKRWQREATMASWIGISLDEVQRMKPSRAAFVLNRWPLVEARMTRQACLVWMEKNGYPQPPRSACVYCPFHSDAEWRKLKEHEPESFLAAVAFERAIQEAKSASSNSRATPYLHRSRVPLDQVDLSTDFDKGQLPLWQDECSGMCGV